MLIKKKIKKLWWKYLKSLQWYDYSLGQNDKSKILRVMKKLEIKTSEEKKSKHENTLTG